jgi:hypothetical protein
LPQQPTSNPQEQNSSTVGEATNSSSTLTSSFSRVSHRGSSRPFMDAAEFPSSTDAIVAMHHADDLIDVHRRLELSWRLTWRIRKVLQTRRLVRWIALAGSRVVSREHSNTSSDVRDPQLPAVLPNTR